MFVQEYALNKLGPGGFCKTESQVECNTSTQRNPRFLQIAVVLLEIDHLVAVAMKLSSNLG